MSDVFEDVYEPERFEDRSASIEGEPSAEEDLPPVEPPSAGFILRLFLVPAVIVIAVVAVWALFGKLASAEGDWQSLVGELRANVGPGGNEHRLWRAALGLAQMLKAEQGETEEPTLARNPQVAGELSALLKRELDRHTQKEDEIKQQAFLARTLGWLDVPETVVPVLQTAMQPEHDREVRKNAIASLAMIAGRSAEQGDPLENPALVGELIDTSADADPLIRQMSAYVLGLLPGEAAHNRLIVLLDDADEKTRLNAAVALARQDSTAGWPVLRNILLSEPGGSTPRLTGGEADLPPGATPQERQRELQNRNFEQFVALTNSIKAVGILADKLTVQQRRELRNLLQRLAEEHPQPRIRIEAKKVLQKL